MSEGISPIIFPVRNVDQATKLYSTLLGVEPYTAASYYVGFRIGDQEIGLDPNGHAQGMTGPVAYLNVADIRETVQKLVDAGAQVQQEVKNVGGGLLVATVTDADGNPIGLRQAS